MLELEHRFRVVDVSVRLSPIDDSDTSRGLTITPDRLEREMHQAGITRSIVFPPSRAGTSYVAPNNGVARRSVDRPFVAFARINGTQTPGRNATGRLRNAVRQRTDHHTSPSDIEKYAYDDRFHGFVLDPTVDGYPDDDVLAALEDVDLPVIVRGGVDAPPETLASLLLGRSFPVVVGRFGGHPLNQPLMNEMIDLLGVYDDCYLETSFVRYREQLERALFEHPDRVFFGSGAPACHPNVAVMEILTLDVSEDLLRRAFSKNACRVIDVLTPDSGP
ncbi:amidohydrolase family protein [Natrinema longum]|uniref:Amidohydrolase family protein n=1 Tax=Natrinema longum TaxID=370324 RepID=A0A8A2UH24_9EURY|nr:amidohydrolase family protein [Natrinema longum]MBZ6495410.1 amidohydrolase family protein [Natrinema longum]QSW86618.1 amidohydrolase family protein [Natrinema longum]